MVNIFFGNCDVYLKNYLLIYEDGIIGVFSLVYDIVVIIVYDGSNELVLKFCDSNDFVIIGLVWFQCVVEFVGVLGKVVWKEVVCMVERVLDIWKMILKDLLLFQEYGWMIMSCMEMF